MRTCAVPCESLSCLFLPSIHPCQIMCFTYHWITCISRTLPATKPIQTPVVSPSPLLDSAADDSLYVKCIWRWRRLQGFSSGTCVRVCPLSGMMNGWECNLHWWSDCINTGKKKKKKREKQKVCSKCWGQIFSTESVCYDRIIPVILSSRGWKQVLDQDAGMHSCIRMLAGGP